MNLIGRSILLGTLVLVLATGCGGKRGAKPRGRGAAPKVTADGGAAAVAFAPKLLWRMPLKGRLRVLGVDQGVVVVMSRDKGDRASGRRLAGLSDRDGKVLWQQAKTVRFFERSTPWSTSHAVLQGVFAYAKPTKKVEALDLRTGSKRWLLPGSGGVTALGSDLVVADREVVSLVQPASGTVKLRMALSDPRSGAPGDGLMDRLHFGPRVSRLPGGVLVTRRHGGALQALEATTLAGRWQFDPREALPDRPAHTVAGDRAVLVPLHLPPREEKTRLSGWAREGDGGAPAWSLDLPGSFTRPLVFATAEHVLGVSRTASKRSLLWRVDRATGKLVDSRPFAAPAFCFVGGGVIACQRKDGLAANALDTLKQAWQYAPPTGKVVKTVRQADGVVVLEVGDHVVALRLATGQAAFSVVAAVEKSPYRILQVLGVAGTTLVLLARHLEGTAWGDRILVVGLDLGTGKVVMNARVGRFPRPAPPGQPETPLDPADLPVAFVRASGERPDRIVTVADGPLQVIAVPSGRVLTSRILPGDKDEPFTLVRLVGGRMLVRRAHALHALDLATDTVAWQASLWHRKLLAATADRVILSGEKGELEVQPRPAPNPLESGLRRVTRDACTLVHVSAKRWYCQGTSDLVVLDPTTGETAAKLPRVALLPLDDQLFAAQVLTQKQPGRDAWVALDPASGKELWRQAAPESDATAAGLPAPFVRDTPEPPRWAAAHGELFLVTSADGRCLRAVGQVDGKLRWKACLGEVDGPPVLYQGYLLLAARPEAGPKGQPAEAQALFAVDLATGKVREVFRPETGMQVVLGSAEVVGNVLYASLKPVKGPYTRNEVIALALTK